MNIMCLYVVSAFVVKLTKKKKQTNKQIKTSPIMDASDTYAVTADGTRHASGKPFNGTHFSASFFLFNHKPLSTCECTLSTLRYKKIILHTYGIRRSRC